MSRFYAALHAAHASVVTAGVHHYDGTPAWWTIVALTVAHATRRSES